MTKVEQRRLRDSWGLIGVVVLALFYIASAVYQAAQQDWANAGTKAAIGAMFVAVLIYSRTRQH